MLAVWEDDSNGFPWIWMLLGQNHKHFVKNPKKSFLRFIKFSLKFKLSLSYLNIEFSNVRIYREVLTKNKRSTIIGLVLLLHTDKMWSLW